MGIKKLTVTGDTVDFAILKGLQQIGLTQEQTCIQILQKESDTIFGYREAAIAIVFDEEESDQAIIEKTRHEFESKLLFRFHEGHAQVQVPSLFYDDRYVTSQEEREEFLRKFLEKHEVSDPDAAAITNITTDFHHQYSFVNVKELETFPLNGHGASIHIRLSEDEMSCEAIIFHKEALSLNQVLKALEEQGITYGLLKANISKVLESEFTGLFTIAKGTPAQDDMPGNVEKFFQEDEHKEFSEMMEALTIDTRAVKDINIADRHQLLMNIGDVVPGYNGSTIKGKVIQKKDISESDKGLSFGESVYLSDSGKEIYAKVSGHIVWRPTDGYIDVEPVYIVDGNVDFTEGNIIGFVGKVIIKGDVRPRFSVVAEGDIEIHGCVEDATVRSTSGNVRVAGSVIHKTEGIISAKEAIYCNIATNANLKATQVIIEKEAMNSNIEAEDSLKAEGTPGTIIGGVIEATNLIRVNSIGSERGIATEVHVGDVSELKKRLRTLHQQIMTKAEQLKETKQVHKILDIKLQDGVELTEGQQRQYERLKQEIVDVEDGIEFAREEEEKIKKRIDERKGARLEILKDMFKEVELFIFDSRTVIANTEHYTGFHCPKGTIKRYSL